MAASNTEIWQRLVSEGLVSQTQCHELQQKMVRSLRPGQTQEMLSLLRGLVALGVINNYQARILAGTSKDPLRYGQWLILGRPPGPVWKDWLQIRKSVVTEGEDSHDGPSKPSPAVEQPVHWGRWLNPSTVQQLGGVSSLVSRWREWRRIETKLVQQSEMPTVENNRLLLQVHPIIGEPLSRCAAQAVPNHEQILGWVKNLASVLASIHERSIVYGFLKPDRIFWDRTEGLKIVFEPVDVSGIFRSSDQQKSSVPIRLLHNDLENLADEWFLAPELNRGEQSLGPAADVFSLGAIWWWLLNRESRWESGFLTNLKQLDSQKLGIDRSQVKCLARCLAVNPKERFSSANEFLKELESSPFRPSTGLVGRLENIPARLSQARRKRRTLASFLPLLASGLFLVLALIAMIWSGVFSISRRPDASITAIVPDADSTDPKRATVSNPLEEHFQLVESREYLWAPPSPPQPIDLRGLPPGVQLLVVLHPSRLLQMPNSAKLLELFRANQLLATWLEAEFDYAGVDFGELHRLTIALTSPLASSEITDAASRSLSSPSSSLAPAVVLRLELEKAVAIDRLKSLWKMQPQLSADEQTVLPLVNDRAVYVPPAGSIGETNDEGGVRLFCVGPTNLIREAAELEGAEGPVNIHVKKLLERSNCHYDFSLLASPRFLFSEGKGALQALPVKLQQLIEAALGPESRSLLVQSTVGEQWYWEVQAIGARDSEAVDLLQKWSSQAAQASGQAEALLVKESPHLYWRALAVRFPQMLRLWNQSARFGIEDGAVVANGYLPSIASSNLIAAAWISFQQDASFLQPGAQDSSQPVDIERTSTPESQNQAMEIEEFLNRPIKLSFEQESLERALELIVEEANGSSLSSSQQFRFELDGAGFQKAGITRNQQIRQFHIAEQSVRDALTELVRRGNPIANVADTSDIRQQLVWLVMNDPKTQERNVILLTTRTTALEQQLPLPIEFTGSKDP